MADQTVSVPIAKRVAADVSEDGNLVRLCFETADGPINVAFPAQNLGQMIGHLANVGEKIAGEHQTKIQEQETVNVLPIPVAALGVGQGRADTEAILSLRTGPMTLAFAVDLSTLSGMCERLNKITVKHAPRKPN